VQGLLSYTLVPVDAEGCVSAAAVGSALCPGETAVVSLMHANNETGAIQPVAEAAAAARAAGALVHCDAAQSIGKARGLPRLRRRRLVHLRVRPATWCPVTRRAGVAGRASFNI